MKGTNYLLCLLACAASLHGQTAPAASAGAAAKPATPRYIDNAPYNFNDHTGWVSMFDGSTLKGWNGDMTLWHVQDGAITASSASVTPWAPAYLVWGGGDVKDFEFKTEIKLEGSAGGNSGVQFRAQMLGKTDKKNSEFESFGYQADYDYPNEQTGALIECCSGPHRGPSPRPFKASMGTVVRETDVTPDKPTLIGTTGDPAELKASIHVGGWNELHVIARGTTMMYFLNGRLMSVFIEDNPKRFIDHGKLIIQLEGKGDNKISYRNMWLKTLP